MFSNHGKRFYNKANHFTGGRLSILYNTLVAFSETRASQAAASLAYYAIFSLFPLLLVLISGSSFFLNRQEVFQRVALLVQKAFPIAPQLINENLQQVLDARGPVGVIGLLTLIWSASGVFTNLAFNINQAWPVKSQRNFVQKRLVGMGMILGLGVLFLLSLILDSIPNIIPFFHLTPKGPLESITLKLFSQLGSWLTLFLLFYSLYRWVPSAKVQWNANFWSAVTASVGWKIAVFGYNTYLNEGLGRYKLVYGSLGAIVALLFLIYLMAMITLFGAHLRTAIDRWDKEQSLTEKK